MRYSGNRTKLVIPDAIRSGPLPKKSHSYDTSPEELFARGGQIYGHLEEWIHKHCSNDLKFGATFRDPGGFDGHIIFHTIKVCDKVDRHVGRMLAAHKYADGVVSRTNTHILHDMKYGDDDDAGPAPSMDTVQNEIQNMARAEAEAMATEQKKIWEHRTKSAKKRMAAEAMDIEQEMGNMGFGPQRDALADRLRDLNSRIKEADAEHEMATTLRPDMPILEGWVRVVPDSKGPRHAGPTEKAGMDASMKHEISEGFKPEDVSGRRGIGYDILSTHSDGRRREIEVKASCEVGSIHLTDSEYDHIKNSEHAVMHIMSNVGKPDQRMDVIYDTENMQATKSTGYDVSRSEIDRLSD